MWSLQPGECIVAEQILERLKCEVYFPVHDTGIDLLVVRGDKKVGLQVKESRYFVGREKKGEIGNSWHHVDARKFQRDRNRVNFYVFLTYLPRLGVHRISSFDQKFVIVPTNVLEKNLKSKKSGKKGVYSFYFNFRDKHVTERRDKITDYAKYTDNWKLIDKTLK